MKFTLKDYQEDAVQEVLDRLHKAHLRWHSEGSKHAFSLTAATGAGKTVMAAAVIEALFFGNDDFNFAPDPGAVVIWFSDDPSLNVQSLWRLQEASDKLTISDLITIENSFNRESLEPGKVYFLNTQKLGRNSLLVRGHDVSDPEESAKQPSMLPDMRSFTIWDIIRNTIENTETTLYLVLDEAHRGMKEVKSLSGDSKPTIVRQLINGTGSVPGVPIVVGISATVERFNRAMEGMKGRDTLSNVIVDSRKVQDSGLLKDSIILDVPNDDTGDFTTVLARRGADKLKEMSDAWAKYAQQQADTDVVIPLMVLQVPNSPDPDSIGQIIDAIFERYPELTLDCVANVFGEHRTEKFGRYSAPYIAPERVQESAWVRILLAKDAISTGWDCPRAEVMVSFRAATDKTHITQLLGRMIRSPLARRVPGHDRLNSVDCLLPRFNTKSVQEVVNTLMSGGEDGESNPIRRVLINPKEMRPNPVIDNAVWVKFAQLPSESLPRRHSRPVKRLTAFAHELASDELAVDAGKIAHAQLHSILDESQLLFANEIEKARKSVLEVSGQSIHADIKTGAKSFDDFVEAADYVALEHAFKRAGRIFSPALAHSYSEYLTKSVDDEGQDDALFESHSIVAAIALVPQINERLEKGAAEIAEALMMQHKPAIRILSDERQNAYRQIWEMSDKPICVELVAPRMWMQASTALEPNGNEIQLPRFKNHLLCDSDGMFPDDLNSWEEEVVATELNRSGAIAWYRNPDRASPESLGVVCFNGGEYTTLRPDFIFFNRSGEQISADIVDPHGIHLADALPKLKGLARYAEEHTLLFGRIWSVAKIGNDFRFLNMKDSSVRAAIDSAASAKSVFESHVALHYSS